MDIKIHNINNIAIAEIISDQVVMSNAEEGLDLVGNLYFQGIDKVILHAHNITLDFFDLKNGIAGEILQKFSTYGIQLAIVGDFSMYPGNSLRDFIYESNKGVQVNFVTSVDEALKPLS